MAKYDAALTNLLADSLDQRAQKAVLRGTLAGAFCSFLPLFIFLSVMSSGFHQQLGIPDFLITFLVGALPGGLIGRAMGRRSVLTWRLQAQQARCQALLEERTRPAAG